MQYNIQSNDAQHALNTREIESIGLIFYISNDYYHSGRLTQEIGEQKKKKTKDVEKKEGAVKKNVIDVYFSWFEFHCKGKRNALGH